VEKAEYIAGIGSRFRYQPSSVRRRPF